MQPHVERIYMSERLGTSHGPDIFYEFVFGRVSLGPGHAGSDVVLIRMVYGQQVEDASPAEIHIKDLTEVQERFNDFMDRVRKKIDPAATAYRPGPGLVAPTPAPPGTEPMGRYAPGAPRKAPTGAPPGQQTPAPFVISMGPKKGSGNVGVGSPSTGPATRSYPLQGMGTPPGTGISHDPPSRQGAAAGSDRPFEIISYNLSSPPSTDAILRVSDNAPAKLVVVARFDLVRKVEDYLTKATAAGGKALQTNEFVTIVVDRDKRKGSGGASKMKAAIASGLQRMLGMPKAVLWIPPEPGP